MTLPLLLREIVYRVFCRHRQGDKPNILLYCNRRGGSTWMISTMAAHPGCRYVGRPFLTLLSSRHRKRIPLSGQARLYDGEARTQIIHIEDGEEQEFRELADDIISGRIEVYPALNFRAPYFHRVTDRIILQMTSGGPLIEWFDQNFHVMTGILLRHPISNALSVRKQGWRSHAAEYLDNSRFVDTHLTGAQVDLSRRVLASGSELESHVLDWTLKLLVPVRAFESGRHPSWLAWTYEEAVRDPATIVRLIARHFDFTDVETMLDQANRASRTASRATADRLHEADYLVARWRNEIGSEEERSLLAIPAAFDIDVYQPGLDYAAPLYRHLKEESPRS